MSAGRKLRRSVRPVRFHPRRPGVELSAATRQILAEAWRAHDDPAVGLGEFATFIVDRVVPHVHALPERERVEAALQLGEHVTSHLYGRRLVALGVLRP